MEQTKLTINRVLVNENRTIPTVTVWFAGTIKGYAQEVGENNVSSYNETDVDHISFQRGDLTRQLCDANELIALYRGCRPKAFDQKAFNLLLNGSTINVVRTHHSAGDVVPDRKDADGNDVVYARDCYTTDVVGVELSDIAKTLLDKAISLD